MGGERGGRRRSRHRIRDCCGCWSGSVGRARPGHPPTLRRILFRVGACSVLGKEAMDEFDEVEGSATIGALWRSLRQRRPSEILRHGTDPRGKTRTGKSRRQRQPTMTEYLVLIMKRPSFMNTIRPLLPALVEKNHGESLPPRTMDRRCRPILPPFPTSIHKFHPKNHDVAVRRKPTPNLHRPPTQHPPHPLQLRRAHPPRPRRFDPRRNQLGRSSRSHLQNRSHGRAMRGKNDVVGAIVAVFARAWI